MKAHDCFGPTTTWSSGIRSRKVAISENVLKPHSPSNSVNAERKKTR